MKRSLLIAALIALLVSSLTADTMAYYNVNVNTIAHLRTSAFVFTLEKTAGSFDVPVSIIPGETATYEVKLRNWSEVDLKSTLTADVTNSPSDIGVKIEGTGSQSAELVKKAIIVNTMSPAAVENYTITVSWPLGVAMDNKATESSQGKKFTLKVNANGQQIL